MRDLNEVKEWLNKAEIDYEGALHLFRRRKQPLPDLVCFHCQQAAEKYLKAFLIYHKKPFPKTHDLILLLERKKVFLKAISLISENSCILVLNNE